MPSVAVSSCLGALYAAWHAEVLRAEVWGRSCWLKHLHSRRASPHYGTVKHCGRPVREAFPKGFHVLKQCAHLLRVLNSSMLWFVGEPVVSHLSGLVLLLSATRLAAGAVSRTIAETVSCCAGRPVLKRKSWTSLDRLGVNCLTWLHRSKRQTLLDEQTSH